MDSIPNRRLPQASECPRVIPRYTYLLLNLGTNGEPTKQDPHVTTPVHGNSQINGRIYTLYNIISNPCQETAGFIFISYLKKVSPPTVMTTIDITPAPTLKYYSNITVVPISTSAIQNTSTHLHYCYNRVHPPTLTATETPRGSKPLNIRYRPYMH